MALRSSAVATVLTTTLAMAAIACDGSRPSASSPTGPTTPPTLTNPIPPDIANVSGTVWLHEPEGVKPYAGATLYGWVETPRVGGGPSGRAVTDSSGHYLFRAPVGSRIRIYQGRPPYQPCDVTVAVTGDVTRDVHAVSDPRQLGAGLPQSLRSQFPTLSGVVFEATADGSHAVSDVLVYSDSTGSGGDVVTAATLTGSDGRYVLCGLDGRTSAYVHAWNPGYGLLSKTVVLTGNDTTFDIQLQR